MAGPMDGRTVVVTGGNTGIGKETVIALAGAGAHVVFTARDAGKGQVALTDARERSGNDSIEVMELDLASFSSVRDFAHRFAAAHDRLDVLVNNAGVILTKRTETVDGHETTFQVNHLSPFLLTLQLRDVLVAGDEARVVNISSTMHSSARHGLDFDDLESRRHFRGSEVYARTKLANVLFTRELARRWRDTGVTANAVHPGFVASGFGKDGDAHGLTAVALSLLKPFALDPEQGARTQVYVASAPELAGITGGYWAKSAPAQPSRAAGDDAAAARLWEVSETMTA